MFHADRLRSLGLLGVEEDLRSLVERNSVLLGKLASDSSIGGILFGLEPTNTGVILVARSTANLTVTTTAQSIVGDGDSTKVRLLLPTIGTWLIVAVMDVHITTLLANGVVLGELFVNDSGASETGIAVKEMETLDRATVAQQWKVVTEETNIPVELKAKEATAGGVGVIGTANTCISALRTRIGA